jgi:hypothetical protein
VDLPSARIIFVKETPDSLPVVGIMTNALSTQMAAEDILSVFLLRWPNLQRGQNILFVKNDKIENSSQEILKEHGVSTKAPEGLSRPLNLIQYFRQVLDFYEQYACAEFFPEHVQNMDVTSIISAFYIIPGTFEEKERNLLVTLKISPEAYPYEEDLEYAIKRVNESEVTNPAGKRLIMCLDRGQ